jgi:hypothetical protein
MIKLLKVFIAGTVINLIAVPFLFSQEWKLIQKHENAISTGSALMHNSTEYSLTDSTKPKDSTFTVKEESTKKFKMKKKPWVAVLLSAVLPGAGQFYNESYWKVPILLGLTGYFAYVWVKQNDKYKDYRDQYAASQVQYPPDGDPNLKALREFYHNQRNDFTWYFLIVYFINLVDAYVDAHLFDFDVREERISSMGTVDRKFKLNVHVPIK